MVRLLVQHGARLDIRNNEGMTPTMLADRSRKPDVVQALSGV
jgi:ankyrin repeat protein